MTQNIKNDITLDFEVLEEIKTYTGDQFSTVISSFFTSYVSHIENIRNALAKQDFSTISKDAHAMKSVGAQIGALKFSALAQKLEFLEPEIDSYIQDAQQLCAELESEYHTLEPLLKKQL